jgi:cation-transporting P-type ATPase E
MNDIRYIVVRNVFSLTNTIITAVVILLYLFGDRQAALFLSITTILNTVIGVFQDARAWITLKRLQLLTAPRALRIEKDGSKTEVLVEEVAKNDKIELKVGDQVPCDGVLVEAEGFEVNEGLITGESHLLPKKEKDSIAAGSIVTSGMAVMRVKKVYLESRIARMTEGIKKFEVRLSPIQYSTQLFIAAAGYVMIAVVVLVVLRGWLVQEEPVTVVQSVGALASLLVPQGLLFVITLFFAYGAANMYRNHVLLTEIAATEKLGRVKNLCMDKTGTLTEDMLVVESICTPDTILEEDAKRLTAAYIEGTGETSQTNRAIKDFLAYPFKGIIKDARTFSSWRRFGAVHTLYGQDDRVVMAGAPSLFLPHLKHEQEQQWLARQLDQFKQEGKHLVCVVQQPGSDIPKELTTQECSLVAVFVFKNRLREGISHIVDFFQKRDIHIRIISGDIAEVVQRVAKAAGVVNTDKVITGNEMKNWQNADFEKNVHLYTIFAGIVPEMKEKIVAAFKTTGFTAMVGDGANDALAIKKADLGIAMFDGAPATRQMASVVLTNNSFAALPGGVRLADSIINNIEILSSLFLNQMIFGFLFFVGVSILGYGFPLVPLNITLINYFIVGMPCFLIFYWAIWPADQVDAASSKPFWQRVVPFALVSAILQAVCLTVFYYMIVEKTTIEELRTLIALGFIVLGNIFIWFTPRVYNGITQPAQKRHFVWMATAQVLILIVGFQIPILRLFFFVTTVALPLVFQLLFLVASFELLHYIIFRKYFFNIQIKK